MYWIFDEILKLELVLYSNRAMLILNSRIPQMTMPKNFQGRIV